MASIDPRIEAKVEPPATALLVVGALNALLAIVIIVSGFVTRSFNLGPPEGIIGMASLGASAVVVIGAWRMRRCQSLGWAYGASILAMIPCLSTCFLVGLPVGIWAIVVLSSDAVRSAFRAAQSAEPDSTADRPRE